MVSGLLNSFILFTNSGSLLTQFEFTGPWEHQRFTTDCSPSPTLMYISYSSNILFFIISKVCHVTSSPLLLQMMTVSPSP